MSDATLPRFYTYQQIAEVFQVQAKTIYNWFRARPKFKYRNTVRLSEGEVQRLVEERTEARPSPALLARWDKVKRTPRPGTPASNDTRIASKPAQNALARPSVSV